MFEVNELLKATKGKLISGIKNKKVKGISIDSRTIKKDEAFVAIKGDKFDGHDFIAEAIKKGAAAVLVQHRCIRAKEKGVAIIEVRDTISSLGDIAQSHRQRFALPIIAITGSNGKTTAKEMIAWVLSEKFKVLKSSGTKNNHIGLPLALLSLDGAHNLAVLELGTNHFGEIDYLAGILKPNIGIITNIGPSHLEFFKDLKGVFREKISLIKYLQRPYIAILNADDNLLRGKVIKGIKNPSVFSFGIKRKSDFQATEVKVLSDRLEFKVNHKYRFRLWSLGYQNIYNALIAITLARIFGMEYEDIYKKLFEFNFLENRLKLTEINKIKFIDDTYNSNPISLRQALEALDNFMAKGRKIFVMGDMLELGRWGEFFHRQAGRLAAQVCDVFITVGSLSRISAEEARRSGFNTRKLFTCYSTDEARDILLRKVSPGVNDIVLIKGSRAMRMEGLLE